MADLQGRKVFKVFNQDFIVDERYNVTKELGQGAYGIVWYVIQSICLSIVWPLVFVIHDRWTNLQEHAHSAYTLQRGHQ